jgi:hypothetical protein
VTENLAVGKFDVSDPAVESGEDCASLGLDDSAIYVLSCKRPDRVDRFPA